MDVKASGFKRMGGTTFVDLKELHKREVEEEMRRKEEYEKERKRREKEREKEVKDAQMAIKLAVWLLIAITLFILHVKVRAMEIEWLYENGWQNDEFIQSVLTMVDLQTGIALVVIVLFALLGEFLEWMIIKKVEDKL